MLPDRPTSYRVGQVLLMIAAGAAALAAIGSIADVVDASADTRMVEAWRCVGLATFAVIFAALAHRPDTSRLVWVAVVANKLALTVLALIWSTGETAGVSAVLAWDLALTVVLVGAYLLTHAPVYRSN